MEADYLMTLYHLHEWNDT